MSGLTNDRMQSGEMARHGPEDLRAEGQVLRRAGKPGVAYRQERFGKVPPRGGGLHPNRVCIKKE